jgi:translation initiation factor IF-1
MEVANEKAVLAMMFAAGLASGPVWAHEGHAHKVMGTVSVIHENHLEVKATDGKTATVTLTDKTKVVRGKTALKPADIRTGDRVVVTATETKGKDGKTFLLASQVQLGTAGTPSAKK